MASIFDGITHYRIIYGCIASIPLKDQAQACVATVTLDCGDGPMTDLARRPDHISRSSPLAKVAVRPDYALTDRYTASDGRVFLSGVQALARIALEQLRVDRTNGLNTAAFVSGYPGSPLAGFDKEAAAVARVANQHESYAYLAQPGLNEE
jgi:hypothetical protein